MTTDYRTTIIKNLETLRQRDFANNDKWKVRAYDTVLKQLRQRTEPIYTIDDVKDIKGVGEKIKKKIEEIIETGELQQVHKIEETLSKMMTATDELSQVFGIGPVKAKELFEKYGINTVDELSKHPELLNEKQKIGVKYWKDFNQRIPRKEMIKHEDYLRDKIAQIDEKMRFVIMGSYRRGALNSGDIDVLLTHPDNDPKYFEELVKGLQKDKYLAETLGQGDKKYVGICRLKRHRTYRRIDMLFAKRNEYAFALLYFTGSANFNVRMRNIAISQGYSLSEHGIKYLEGANKGKFVETEFPDEQSIFKFLGMDYVEPEGRH